MNPKTRLEQLNESLNVLAICVILYSPIFIWMGAKDLGGQLIAGAIGLMGGKAINQAASRRAADFPKENTDAKTDSGNPANPAAG